MNLDRDLLRALEREDPSEGFSDRVVAALSEYLIRPVGPAKAPFPFGRRRRAWFAFGVAASFLLAVATGRYAVERRQAHQAEQAKRDLEVALRITSDTLQEIQIKLSATSGKDASKP